MVDRYKPIELNVTSEIERAKASRSGFSEAWDALDEEYSALSSLITARTNSGLTREELAARMGTTKSAVSRLESSFRGTKYSPSFATLQKYAHACGKRLIIRFE